MVTGEVLGWECVRVSLCKSLLRRPKRQIPQPVMKTLNRCVIVLLAFAAVQCRASFVDSRTLGCTKSSFVSTDQAVWLASPRACYRARPYGFQISLTQQHGQSEFSSKQQRSVGSSLKGSKNVGVFASTGGIFFNEAFSARYNKRSFTFWPTRTWARLDASAPPCLCMGQPFVAQMRPVAPPSGNTVCLCHRTEYMAGFSRLTGARRGVRVFATPRMASGIPLTSKQLKRREQAEVQIASDSVVNTSETVDEKNQEEERRKRIKEWRVVLHNDDIHTFEFVESAITTTLPHISLARAYDIALHAHTNRKATIMLTWEEKAREIAIALQDKGLTVSILPDKIFKESA